MIHIMALDPKNCLENSSEWTNGRELLPSDDVENPRVYPRRFPFSLRCRRSSHTCSQVKLCDNTACGVIGSSDILFRSSLLGAIIKLKLENNSPSNENAVEVNLMFYVF